MKDFSSVSKGQIKVLGFFSVPGSFGVLIPLKNAQKAPRNSTSTSWNLVKMHET